MSSSVGLGQDLVPQDRIQGCWRKIARVAPARPRGVHLWAGRKSPSASTSAQAAMR